MDKAGARELFCPYNSYISLKLVDNEKSMLEYKLAEYVSSLSYDELSSTVIEEAKRRVLDSVAVMIAAYEAEPVKIAMMSARHAKSYRGARLLGSGEVAPPDWVAFVNGIMVRFLDFNDTYLAREALHPSDMIPALIALAEANEAGGRDLLLAIVTSYEVACRLADSASIRDKGFDHVAYIAIGTAVGSSKILQLDVEKTRHAINIATVAGAALRQTRSGELSMWKGCAAANAARHGVFAALLASEGMTGPSPIFEGELGFWNVVSGRFDIARFGGRDGEEFRIINTSIKNWPVEYHAMSAVEAAIRVREDLRGRLEEIERISVKTSTVSHKIIAKDPEKWRPKTRETADHSLPYIVARALLDGYIWLDSYEAEKIYDPKLERLISRLKVEVDPRYDELYPEAVANRVEVETSSGMKAEAEVLYPTGHFKNPLKIQQLMEKFTKLCSLKMGDDRVKELAEKIKGLHKLESVSDLTELLIF